jgi:hypothetical protein
MKKVKLLFAASALATISFFAINSNESVAGDPRCNGSIKVKDGVAECTRYQTGCKRGCGFLEMDIL